MEDEKESVDMDLHVSLLREAYEEIRHNDDNGILQILLHDYVMAIMQRYTSKQVHSHI